MANAQKKIDKTDTVQERLERKKLTIARDASEATGRQANPDSEKCDTNAKT
jgi:hypothetical protein